MEQTDETVQPKEEGYVPRPKWQLWAAGSGLCFFFCW